jgi:Mrp family chromosome partitioning ATPase
MPSRSKKLTPANAEPLVVVSPSNVLLASYPFEVVEALRYLIARASRQSQLPRRLSILSPLRQEGVTYLSRGLAATLANDLRATVCAVELNWWWPSTLPVSPQQGLAGVLAGQVSLDDALVSTTDPCLAWMPAGDLDPNQRSLAAHSQALEAVLSDLNRQFDYVILDVPAIRATSDALPLASLGSAGCLVISQGGATVDTTKRALEEIAPLPILGVLLNRIQFKTPRFILKFIPET